MRKSNSFSAGFRKIKKRINTIANYTTITRKIILIMLTSPFLCSPEIMFLTVWVALATSSRFTVSDTSFRSYRSSSRTTWRGSCNYNYKKTEISDSVEEISCLEKKQYLPFLSNIFHIFQWQFRHFRQYSVTEEGGLLHIHVFLKNFFSFQTSPLPPFFFFFLTKTKKEGDLFFLFFFLRRVFFPKIYF